MKSRHVIAEGSGCAAETPLQPADAPNAVANPVLEAALVALRAGVPLTMAEAATYLRYEGPRGPEMVTRFLRDRGVFLLKRGNVLLVRPRDLESLWESALSDRDRHAHSIARAMRQRKATPLRAVTEGAK